MSFQIGDGASIETLVVGMDDDDDFAETIMPEETVERLSEHRTTADAAILFRSFLWVTRSLASARSHYDNSRLQFQTWLPGLHPCLPIGYPQSGFRTIALKAATIELARRLIAVKEVFAANHRLSEPFKRKPRSVQTTIQGNGKMTRLLIVAGMVASTAFATGCTTTERRASGAVVGGVGGAVVGDAIAGTGGAIVGGVGGAVAGATIAENL